MRQVYDNGATPNQTCAAAAYNTAQVCVFVEVEQVQSQSPYNKAMHW